LLKKEKSIPVVAQYTCGRHVKLVIPAASAWQLALSHGLVEDPQVAKLVVGIGPIICHWQLPDILLRQAGP
jgi:hypothetical protein